MEMPRSATSKMYLHNAIWRRQAIAVAALVGLASAVPLTPPSDTTPEMQPRLQRDLPGPFKILDPQNWVNPDNMTWEDYLAPPGTTWNDSSVRGSERNFNIALVTVDYTDRPFSISQDPAATVFGNPQPILSGLAREEVPAFYRDFLNKPSDLNHYRTIHEYWMEDSGGRFGVDLTAFGPYLLPSLSYQYGIDNGFNAGACPEEGPCSLDIRKDALGLWRADIGNDTADSYELVFILSSGQDESSTWQEFGEMKFQTKEDVPDEFGPPNDESLPNYSATRYISWTSWAAASSLWPNAGGGSSTQAESSGMATYAHELTHLLGIGDNYNNPYSDPPRRSYTGPWSMLSRGSFNGPKGPHTRWKIPATEGGSLGSAHTMGDKMRIGLVDDSKVLMISRDELAKSGPVVAEITARCVNPGEEELMGIHIMMGDDLSPSCDVSTDALCDGGNYNNYDMEVIDRMGSDTFTPDSGVMLSKTKDKDNAPFQWTIDAHPEDINITDFYRPDGSISMLSIGDYRQLADALFHAGTRSGSEFEYIDEPNRLHMYIIDIRRDDAGVLHYTVGARSLDGSGLSTHGVELEEGQVAEGPTARATGNGVICGFQLTNSGAFADGGAVHPQDVAAYTNSDIYRLSAEVDADGWRVELPNALATAPFGGSAIVKVAVQAASDAASSAVVRLNVTSESDPSVTMIQECQVSK
ncbi:M6 metalloprotease [Hypoxylon sp. FL1284]|nr:M6 metalloprotease [Hypoxylon sp. FL1284]